MLIENEFTVAPPVDDALGLPARRRADRPVHARRRAHRDVDDQNWKGKVNVKFGPVALSFAGTVEMTERDDDAHRAVLHAKGMEQKGKGAANATVTSWLEPAADGETTVKMTADITLTGAAAQLSRGLLPEISKKLTQQFADCLEATMDAEQALRRRRSASRRGEPPTRRPRPRPLPRRPRSPRSTSAASASASRRSGPIIKNFFRRLFGGGSQDVTPGVITGVVLAAGEGPRFGGTKQLAVLDGKPLAQHAIDALAEAGVDELLVVTGHDADAVEQALTLPDDGRFVRNPAYRDGQATSLAAAFHEVDDDSEAAVVLMADQPGITADDVRALDRAVPRDAQADRAPAVHRRARPALLSREIYAEAGHLHGDVGARVLIASHPEWVEEVDVAGAAPRDIDTRADLERVVIRRPGSHTHWPSDRLHARLGAWARPRGSTIVRSSSTGGSPPALATNGSWRRSSRARRPGVRPTSTPISICTWSSPTTTSTRSSRTANA